jgi:hypothetical protein
MKRWYPTTSLQGIITQKTKARIFTAVKISSLTYRLYFFAHDILSLICCELHIIHKTKGACMTLNNVFEFIISFC